MEIREAKQEDIGEIYSIGIGNDAFKVSDESGFWSKEQLIGLMESKTDLFLVAIVDESIIGFTISRINEPTKVAFMDNMWISVDKRKNGYGKKLLDRTIKEIKSKGVEYISLLIKTNNEEATSFFKKEGFNVGYDFNWVEKEI